MLDWDFWSHVSIVNGILGASVFGAISFAWSKIRLALKRRELESYLFAKKRDYGLRKADAYIHTVEHLTINTSLTAHEIDTVSKNNKKLVRHPRQDHNKMATGYLLEYAGDV